MEASVSAKKMTCRSISGSFANALKTGMRYGEMISDRMTRRVLIAHTRYISERAVLLDVPACGVTAQHRGQHFRYGHEVARSAEACVVPHSTRLRYQEKSGDRFACER